ncbi:hypothetical protein BH11ARM1_BH11ARM1_03210 [soil metagenome]
MKTLFLIPLALLLGACASNPDEAEDIDSKPVAFSGKVDPQFVGTWKTTNNISVYHLEKDGTYKLDSKVQVSKGPTINSHLEGKWLVDSDRMLFKDAQGNVVPYTLKLTDKTLELTLTGSMKNKTTLERQPL